MPKFLAQVMLSNLSTALHLEAILNTMSEEISF